MFTHKTHHLLIVVTALFFTLSLNATDIKIQVESCANDDLFIPVSTLSFIGTFLEERELFILAIWHKNTNTRNAILTASGDEKKLKFYKEIKRYNDIKEELSRKQSLLYPKFALRTCLCGAEVLVKTPI